MDTDFLLIQKMRQGEENAFDLFVRKHYEEILKYCHFHCPDLSYAEDLTQETFLHFFERLSDYHYIGKTRNYLYTIAGNLCKDYYKKKKECFLEEQGRMLGYRDFLRVQLRLVRKRWWCLQAMLLFILCGFGRAVTRHGAPFRKVGRRVLVPQCAEHRVRAQPILVGLHE